MPAILKLSGGVGGSPIVTAKLWEVLAPEESFTVTTMVAAPGAVGVPEIAPAADMLMPAGSPLALKVYGAIPPDAAKLAAYAVPTVPLGADAVVIANAAAAMVMVKDFVTTAGAFGAPNGGGGPVSFTVALTVNLPAVVGLPLMAPAAVAVKPGGKPVTVQEYGPVPPDELRPAV